MAAGYEGTSIKRRRIMTVGDRVYELMKIRGLSQKEFCEMSGISQSTVSDWHRKKRDPSAGSILKICEILKVSPYELLQSDTDPEVQKVDYIVVSEGTPGYELLIEYDKLEERQKERVMGYILALQSE